MREKIKEKIVYLELKESPVGDLFVGASRKGLAFLSFGKRSEKKVVEEESRRFGRSAALLKIGSLKWKSLAAGAQPKKKPLKIEAALKPGLRKRSSVMEKQLEPGPGAKPSEASRDAEDQIRTIRDAARQLLDYFSGRLKEFQMKKDLAGITDFERNVLKELDKIPCGKTSSYQEIARRVGRPKAARAVGNAVGKNPFAIITPCHRVLKSDGTIGGFGAPISVKKFLLSHESGPLNKFS